MSDTQHMITPQEFATLARPCSRHLDDDEVMAYVSECEQLYIIPAIFQFHKGAIETRCFRKCKLLIYNEVLREQSYDFIIKKCRWLIIYFCAFCDNRHNNWGYNKSKTSFYSKRFVIKALKNRSTTCITRNCRLPFFLFQVFVCSYYSPFCL